MTRLGWRWPRVSIFSRVWGHGLLLLVLAIGSIVLTAWLFDPRGALERSRAELADTLAARLALDAPAPLGPRIEELERELGVRVSVYGPDGELLGASHDPPLPLPSPLPGLVDGVDAVLTLPLTPLSPSPSASADSAPRALSTRGRRTGRRHGLLVVRLPTSDAARSGHAIADLPAPDVGWLSVGVLSALVLLGLSAVSYVQARSMTRPLARLAAAMRRFAGGDASARARLTRADELGQLARTFDELADTVERMRRVERELLAGVSHELRTPLARMRVALELVEDGEPGAASRHLGGLAADLAELEDLLDGALAVARLQLGTTETPLRLTQLTVDELLSAAEARFAARHASRALRVERAEVSATLTADPVLLRRAVDNVLDNAAKHTPPERDPIVLRAAVDASATQVTVVDRGEGMSAEDAARAFEPFFRADQSRSRSTGGVGLGLALTRRVVEAHGGTVALESTVGGGTTVTLALPLAARSG